MSAAVAQAARRWAMKGGDKQLNILSHWICMLPKLSKRPGYHHQPPTATRYSLIISEHVLPKSCHMTILSNLVNKKLAKLVDIHNIRQNKCYHTYHSPEKKTVYSRLWSKMLSQALWKLMVAHQQQGFPWVTT